MLATKSRSKMSESKHRSSPPGTIDLVGFWIGRRKRGGRFVRYPDGEIRKVDRDFDTRVFADPDSLPASEATEPRAEACEQIVPDLPPAAESVETIASALLKASPNALVTIYHDRTGKVLGSTITPAKRGLAAAVFRAALRNLPSRAKQVTFAAGGKIATDVRDAATAAAEVCLLSVRGFISR